MQKGMKMTYLFDAKYRIDGRDAKGVDTPPEDAINQMHRYRDAIYYKDHTSDELKKEVIGDYILFPGDGEPANVEVPRFYRTIDEVAPIHNNMFYGFYKVESVNTHEIPEDKYPVRLEFKLSKYTRLDSPVNYGIQQLAARGVTFTKDAFEEYCKRHESFITGMPTSI